MTDIQERATTQVSDAAGGGEKGASAAKKKTAGAVRPVVGMLTGGLAIAAVTGFAVGVAVGVVVGWRATPSTPRWQVWR
jgi:predicted MFS family arabinose efflux permease